MMESCSRSRLVPLTLIYITLLSGLEAQNVHVLPEVIGYLRHNVTLPCQVIGGPENISIVQVQWTLLPPGEKDISIIIYNSQHGMTISDSPLRERVELAEQSLIIKDVEMRDAGSYMCRLTTFPSGSLTGTTSLVVREQMPLSPRMVSGIAVAVILLVGIMAAIAYFILIRRHDPSVRHHFVIDTGGTDTDVVRPAVAVRDGDVVYSEVRLKQSRNVKPSSNVKQIKATNTEVTYAEVTVWGHQAK